MCPVLALRFSNRLFVLSQQMDEAMREFSKNPKLKETDSVFVVFMSHGKLGAVLGVNHSADVEDEFPVDSIYKYLNTKNCPALRNKPKVIVIQACRGGDSHFNSKQMSS